jgi:hypothetical protein
VTDTRLKNALNDAAGPVDGWTSYGYYVEDTISDFMVYTDVDYNGFRYRGVYFSEYRPPVTVTTPGVPVSALQEYEFQQYRNNYKKQTIYWFKYEPIKWRILSETGSDAFLCAELIIDAMDFHFTRSSSGGFYANNYERSHIRSWLNGTFLETAFTAAERSAIKITAVDNSASLLSEEPINDFSCADTNDRIFLLSYSEATSREYGFGTETVREKSPTAYAKAQGAHVVSKMGYWWLRSPGVYYDSTVHAVGHNGYFSNAADVSSTMGGVVPALHLDLFGAD